MNMIRILSSAALLIWAACATTSTSKQINDHSPEKLLFGKRITKAEFEEIAAFFGTEVKRSKPPFFVPIEYQNTPLPKTYTVEQFRQSAQRSFALLSEIDDRRARVQLHLGMVPNLYFGEVTAVRWKGLHDPRGPSVLDSKLEEKGTLDRGDLTLSLDIVVGKHVAMEAIPNWRGSVEIDFNVPASFERHVLTRHSRESGDFRLVAIERGYIHLEDKYGRFIKIPENSPKHHEKALIFALSHDGKPLRKKAHTSLHVQAAEILAKPWHQIPARLDYKDTKQQFKGLYASNVDKVLIYVPRDRHKQTITLTAYPTHDAGGTRYVTERPMELCNLSAKQWGAALRIHGSRSEAVVSEQEPELIVEFPGCDTSSFAQMKFDNLRFFNKSGKALKGVETTGEHFSRDSDTMETRLSSPENDTRMNELFRVDGTLLAQYPKLKVLRMTRQQKNAPPFSTKFMPHGVVLAENCEACSWCNQCMARPRAFASKHVQEFRVFDQTGLPIHNEVVYPIIGDTKIATWGVPEAVEVVLLEYMTSIQCDFSVAFQPIQTKHLQCKVLSPPTPDSPTDFVGWAKMGRRAPIATRRMISALKRGVRSERIEDVWQELQQAEYLDLSKSSLTDVRLLEGLTNLVRLDLSGNQIMDVRPLASLRKLTMLNLERNRISDFTPVENLPNLRFLGTQENPGAKKAEAERIPETIDTPRDVAQPPKNARKTKLGVFYRFLRKTKRGKKPRKSDTVTVHYSGWTTDGKMFDSSVTRKRPATFPLRHVIPGWTDGLQQMRVGDKIRLWIPERLAYRGAPGRPQGMLVFDVELLEIKPR